MGKSLFAALMDMVLWDFSCEKLREFIDKPWIGATMIDWTTDGTCVFPAHYRDVTCERVLHGCQAK